MNIPRLLIAIGVGFVFLMGSDMLVHGALLGADYEATKPLWRTDAGMQERFVWMILGHVLTAATFVIIWAKGAPGRAVTTGIVFGLLMGAFQQVWAIFNYVVMPIPGDIAAKWFFTGVVQAAVLGALTALIYRPRVVQM